MRYILLLALCMPISLLALMNLISQFKMNKINKTRFKNQLLIWIIVSFIIITSFPLYNTIINKPLLDSKELSLFDIVQTCSILILLYIVNHQRQRIDNNEKKIRKLHENISITLSDN